MCARTFHKYQEVFSALQTLHAFLVAIMVSRCSNREQYLVDKLVQINEICCMMILLVMCLLMVAVLSFAFWHVRKQFHPVILIE